LILVGIDKRGVRPDAVEIAAVLENLFRRSNAEVGIEKALQRRWRLATNLLPSPVYASSIFHLPSFHISLLRCFAEDFPMTRSKLVLSSALGLATLMGGVLIAQGPRHPNLRAAQDLIDRAFDRITAAQGANEFDMDGHAAKAKELLEQAKREIRLAAEAANRH
jgi:hypothetical protein